MIVLLLCANKIFIGITEISIFIKNLNENILGLMPTVIWYHSHLYISFTGEQEKINFFPLILKKKNKFSIIHKC